MFSGKAVSPKSQAPRGHDCLVADDLVLGPPTFDTPWLGIIPNIPGLKKRLRAKPTPSDAMLVKRAEKATGRRASGVTCNSDGSRTVEFSERKSESPDEAVALLDLWRAKRHAKG